MRTLRFMPLPVTLLIAAHALGQAPAPAAPPPASEGAVQAAGVEVTGVEGAHEGGLETAPERRIGFTTGLRLGIGVPLGKAGQDVLAGQARDLSDLAAWRAPVWIDVGYSPSGSTTLGAYAQVGVGGNGDYCQADCDWSDIRIGAEAEWRLAPGAAVDPWIGIGLGYEWLSYRVLITAMVPNDMGELESVFGRVTERFGGPELMLHGGVDFQVEDALRIGPYASATLGHYLSDSFACRPSNDLCPEDGSIDGSELHSWIGVGVRGAYTP